MGRMKCKSSALRCLTGVALSARVLWEILFQFSLNVACFYSAPYSYVGCTRHGRVRHAYTLCTDRIRILLTQTYHLLVAQCQQSARAWPHMSCTEHVPAAINRGLHLSL